MQTEDLERLRAKHQHLLALCKGGARRSVAVPLEKLRKSDDERAFCALCATHEPRMDFVLKLYGLQEQFMQTAPPPPEGDEPSAAAYLDACIEAVRAEAARTPTDQMRELARTTVLRFGAHFSGKLINSNAQHAALLASARPSSQPHVTSRALARAGIRMPLDQSRLDNSGTYQRIAMILEGDSEIADSALPTEHIEAIQQGAAQAFEQAATAAIADAVDHRLRQILLPSNGQYIAVSPLPSAGLAALWNTRRTAAPTPTPEAMPAQRRLETVELPIGGAIVRNTTRLPASSIQTQLFFPVPQTHENIQALFRFVYRGWTPQMQSSDVDAAAAQIERFAHSPTLGDSASLLAVDVQATGALASLARSCHRQATDLAQDIEQGSFPEDQEQVPIDESLLRRKRAGELTAIDMAILRQSFGAEYRSELARLIVRTLRARSRRTEGTDALMREIHRERVTRAIEQALERL